MTNNARPTVTIKGNVTAASVNFGEQTFHGPVTFTFNGAPAAPVDVAQQLQALYQQLADALAAVPADQGREVTAVQMAAEDALAEAEKEQPDQERLQIRGDKLVEAARNLLTVARDRFAYLCVPDFNKA